MKFYIATILIGMAAIIGVNLIINPLLYSLNWYWIVLAVVIDTVAVIAVDGVFAFIIRHLPNKWFFAGPRIFKVSKRELEFYDLIRIRKWKDKVLELGGQFTAFSKKKVVNPSDNVYVDRFIMECNYGYMVHLACILFGFLIIFFYPLRYALMFGVPVALVNAFLNALPVCILRYNVPKLEVLHKRNLKRLALSAQKTDNPSLCDKAVDMPKASVSDNPKKID